MANDKRKYNKLENVLNKINKEFIALSKEDQYRNNSILIELLELLTTKMRQTNDLFGALYTRVFYGGSFYDGLRVGQPDEFDLDLLLTLPRLIKATRTVANVRGYITVQLDLSDYNKQPGLKDRYKGLEKLLDERNYLDNEKVRRWMEGVVISTLNKFSQQNGTYTLPMQRGTLFAKIHKAGPAFTLKVNGNVGVTGINLDIDLVPCFEFTSDYWPPSPFTSNPVRNKSTFFIVPKPIKNCLPDSNRCWRLSFQEQERVLIDGKGFLKPSIRLIKKLRDRFQHKYIASYYIKTVALWEIEKRSSDPEFWVSSLNYVFMTLLKSFVEMLENGKILYYWNKRNNLIESMPESLKVNMVGRFRGMMNDVERHLSDDPTIIAKYLLTPTEYMIFMNDGNILDVPVQQSTNTTSSNGSNCQIM